MLAKCALEYCCQIGPLVWQVGQRWRLQSQGCSIEISGNRVDLWRAA